MTGQRSLSLRLLTLLMATTSFAAITAAQAQDTTPTETEEKAPRATQLDAVTSTATRNPSSIHDVAGTVSVITAEEMEQQNAFRMRDIIRYEPGVSVGNQPSRAGATNYVIRGIGGNRVLVLMDGLPTTDFPQSNEGPGTYTRDFFDIENMKSLEIVRGPASALYGSDGLGGTIAYVTKDPADYLDGTGKDWYGSVKAGYESAGKTRSFTGTGAMRAGNVELLGLYTRRDGEEIKPNSSWVANPQDFQSDSFLAKLVFNAATGNRLKLTGDYLNRKVDTVLNDELGTASGTTTLSSLGTDETERYSISLAYTHANPFLFVDSAEIKFGYTTLDRWEHTDQLRRTGGTDFLRVSDLGFLQDVWAVDLQFNTTRDFFGATHSFTYGAVADYTESSRPRYRTEENLTTGVITNNVGSIQFPAKYFPDTETIKAGFFIQDDISLGRLNVIPAIRFDYYNMEPKPDWMYQNVANPAFTPVEVTETEISPKLGVTFDVTEEYKLFAQYAHGFRAPPYDSLNSGFEHSVFVPFPPPGSTFTYRFIPNPDLKPETSDGYEAGIRGRFASGSSFQLSAFYNEYEDFIETVTLPGSTPADTTFQFQNLSEVTIFGAEARGEYAATPEWTLNGAASYARGEDDRTGAPIDSVDPVKAVIGVAYDNGTWGSEIAFTHAWRHDRVSTIGNVQTPSYSVIDIMAHYNLTEALTLNAGVFNLTDEEYYISQDLIGITAGNPVIPRYAQPGRSVAFNATVRF